MFGRSFFILALLAPILVVDQSHALSRVTGSRLLHDCRAAIKSTDVNPKLTVEEDRAADRCISYVQGVLDSNGFWRVIDERDHNPMRHYCLDDDVSLEQVIRLIAQYLEANPKELSENGWVCIQAALLRNYPCKAQKD